VSIVTKQLREGDHYTSRILAVGERNTSGRLICPTLDFISDCKLNFPRDLERISASLEFFARTGRLDVEEKFKRLPGTDQIYEFRTKGGLRLYCFFDEQRVVICTHGYVKKKQKTPQSVITEAETWKNRYFHAKSQNLLTHEPEYT
jgi:phage-related protein